MSSTSSVHEGLTYVYLIHGIMLSVAGLFFCFIIHPICLIAIPVGIIMTISKNRN